jgi:tetratricopeptide (TPR) repeat protein
MQHLKLVEISLVALLGLWQADPPTVGDPAQTYEDGVRAISEADWTVAIERFEQVLAADANHNPSRFYLAVAYDEAGRPEDSIAEYRRLLELDDLY